MSEKQEDIMYRRLEEYETLFRPLDPVEKAIFFFGYSISRVDETIARVNALPTSLEKEVELCPRCKERPIDGYDLCMPCFTSNA